MSVKTLRDLGCETLFRLTLKYSKEITQIEEVWLTFYEIWNYVSILPPTTSALYYKILNKYSHSLSHDCKTTCNELCRFPTLTSDEVFNMLITCQSPKLIFNYKMKRQRMVPSNIIPLVECPVLTKYFETSLNELDLSGADFCCNDSLLITLLPRCHSLQVLSLGNAGSDEVLYAAKSCPLRKLQLEERFPLHPKLPQDTVLKYLLGYDGSTDDLNNLLEVCKSQMLLENAITEESEETKMERIKCLENFLAKCNPWWPNMEILIFGNCRICREALILCLLVLNSLEEISVQRIQSDEILNTCERVSSSFGLKFQISIKRLILWAGWSGFRSNVLQIAPNVDTLCLIAYGYSDLSLRETVERNKTLAKVANLSLVGLRYAGSSIFKDTNPFLGGVKNLEMSGVILTTEELVNIFFCLPNLSKLQLDYSELRNHNYVLADKKHPQNIPLTYFSVETSYIDEECIKALFTMAKKIEYLCIRGKTRRFTMSFAHQEIFLYSPDLKIKYLELYPQYPLDVPGLVCLSKNRKKPNERFQLNVPLSSLTKHELFILLNNGWHVIPVCSRC